MKEECTINNKLYSYSKSYMTADSYGTCKVITADCVIS